ncbi:MAG: helix-turn-helix domain-containing protein [Fusobacterium sp.]|nr:helix-turn-helix domain-containing protein [Fusobacterium sp.]
MDINKIKAENITHEEHLNNVLQDEEYQKMYLNSAIEEFIADGNYDLFFQSLEQVIRARMSISELSKKTGITRKAIYEMFRGERVPRLDTIGKLLKELGYTLYVA